MVMCFHYASSVWGFEGSVVVLCIWCTVSRVSPYVRAGAKIPKRDAPEVKTQSKRSGR